MQHFFVFLFTVFRATKYLTLQYALLSFRRYFCYSGRTRYKKRTLCAQIPTNRFHTYAALRKI